MADIAKVHISTRKGLVDNSLEIGGETILGNGMYMRHIPSGRVYPYEENGAKRDDVEIFRHNVATKTDTKIAKPPKQKSKGPFQRDRAVGAYDQPADKVLGQ